MTSKQSNAFFTMYAIHVFMTTQFTKLKIANLTYNKTCKILGKA